MSKTALLVGGGVDSFAVALTLAETNKDFDLVFVAYGQKCASLEEQACRRLADMVDRKLVIGLSARLIPVNKDGLLFGLGDNPIVKLRNLELIQLTACLGYDTIQLSLLKERSIMFPDANKSFMEKIGIVYKEAYDIEVSAPYIDEDKYDFCVDAHHKRKFFDEVYTCWDSVPGGCGICAHCQKLDKLRSYYKEKYNE